ncbi:hypothetical protein [Dyadobacter bucti]|uniref:hypothetical protein n=1 Tax=Dyadobacter bucti TaxID=2572203 RepID=UPI0011090498|nr:hypothetical protein [Dyadobacter bucti]
MEPKGWRLLLGYLYANQNQYALGLACLFKANPLLEQSGDAQLAPEVLIDIGYAFNALTMYKNRLVIISKPYTSWTISNNYPRTAIYAITNLS